MIARVLEAAGLSTTSISLVREHTQAVKPPRALFVPYPFGSPLGRANDPELQHRVLRAAFDLFAAATGPVLRDFPEADAAEPAAPVQASAVTPAGESTEDPAMETTRMRGYHERWRQQTGRTAVGVSGVPPQRFRGIVRYLEAYADGRQAELRERPADVPLPVFLKWCIDDLKALYYEARLEMRPEASGEAVALWFWGETAMGRLLRRVKQRMEHSDDAQMKAAAFGVAR